MAHWLLENNLRQNLINNFGWTENDVDVLIKHYENLVNFVIDAEKSGLIRRCNIYRKTVVTPTNTSQNIDVKALLSALKAKK